MAEKKKAAASAAPSPASDKKKALETAIAQIERNYGKGAIMRLGDDIPVNVEAISTGSLSLDLALGIGGVPRGRIVEIYGPESCGKTTLALHVVASAQKNGGEAAYIDVEHALEPAYARALGVDIDNLLISQPDTGEQALEITEQLVRSGALDVVVIDSVSKRFSATGARVGAIISRNRELMGHAMKIAQGRLCAATLDQIGAAALYRTMTPEYYDGVRAEYQLRRDAVEAALRKIPGVQFAYPEGAFYVMVKLPVDDADQLQYFLLQEFEDHGDTVMYAPGDGFYAEPGKGRDEVRIAYVNQVEKLQRAIEVLGLGIQAYNAKQKQ